MRLEWEETFSRLAERLVWEHQNAAAAVARIPAMRHSTRAELYRRVLRGRDYLLSSLDRPVVIRDAAAAACLSPYHFHRAFRSIFGEPPRRYLLRQRLEHAARLLARENHTVTEACGEAGFESLPSFSAAFRKRFGVAPRMFGRGAAVSSSGQ